MVQLSSTLAIKNSQEEWENIKIVGHNVQIVLLYMDFDKSDFHYW